jgi:hypothetical protein
MAGLSCAKVRKHFFFEKKKQKTLLCMAAAFPDGHGLNSQKFFASFFQKRSASYPAPM